MLLRDKVIVVSGVGPGLGRTLARLAVEEGAAVVLGARSGDFVDSVVGELCDAGYQAVGQSTERGGLITEVAAEMAEMAETSGSG